MSQIVTCPACQKSLRSDRPLAAGTNLRCPECRTPFAAPAAPSGFPTTLVIAAALILGGSIVTAAWLLSPSRQPAPVADGGDSKKKPEDDPRQRELDEKAKALKAREDQLDADTLVAKGNRALDTGSHEDARKHFQEALKKAPSDPDALKGIEAVAAAVAAAKGKAGDDLKADAKREADRLALIDKAREALAKEPARAVTFLEEAKAMRRGDAEVIDLLAKAQAAVKASETEKKKLDDFEKLMGEARVAMAGNQFADAAAKYGAALAVMPGAPEAVAGKRQAEGKIAAGDDVARKQRQLDQLLAAARAARGQAKYKEAIDLLDQAVRLMPDAPEPARQLRDAQSALKKAQSDNSRLRNRARDALAAGQHDDALRLATDAVTGWAEDDVARKLVRQIEEARETARTAGPRLVDLLANGDLAYSSGRFADAVALYTEALKLQPLNVDIQRALRNAQIALDKDLRNKTEYERLVRVGTQALARRDWLSATKSFNAAIKFLPADLAAKEGLSRARYGKSMQDGQAALAKKQRAAAIAAFNDALEEKPGDTQALLFKRQAQMLKP